MGWESFWHDLRYAARGIRRRPGFAAIVVAMLALGIGANAIMFGVVDRLLLRAPAHVAEPDQVTRIYFREKAGAWLPGRDYTVGPITSYPMLTALQEGVPSLEEVGGFYCSPFTVGRAAEAEEPDVCLVSGNFFRLLGVQPALGRFFTPDEDRPPVGSLVVVLGHGYWQRHFGGANDAVGRQLLIDNQLFTVIGIAPPGFNGVDLGKVGLWVPVSSLASAGFGKNWHSTPSSFWIQPIGRLARGATPERVEAEATAVFRRSVESWNAMGRDPLGQVLPGSLIKARGPEGLPPDAAVSLWLVSVSAIVLLIACANVVNLLLVRSLQRRREIAVRLALGISRARFGRQLLIETLLMAGLAAAGALLVTHWGGQVIRTLLLPDISWGESPVDVRVLAFTLAATVVAGLLAGIAPALQAGATDLTSSLKAGTPEGGRSRSRLRTALLVVQAAFSVVLLIGAGLFVRSLARVRALDVGIDLDRVLLARMDLRRAGMSPQRVQEVFRTARERVRRLPGVEKAVLVGASVPKRSGNAIPLLLPGRESIPMLPGGGPYYSAVDADYFATLGTKVVRGRALTEADEATGARVAVVNETMARHFWPAGEPIGQCLLLLEASGQPCTEVVGVVQNVVMFSVMDERALYYLPLTHPVVVKSPPDALLIRAARGFPQLGGTVRREIQALAPDMPYVGVQSYEELVAPELQPWRMGAMMFTVFGGLALVIAAVGLYSVVAYLVTQRTHEIGVRMTLGADAADVVSLVLGDAARVVAAGLGLGVAVALIAGQWVQPLLYQTSPRDPVVIAAVAATLAAAALAASVVPARRASRVNPVVALRAE